MQEYILFGRAVLAFVFLLFASLFRGAVAGGRGGAGATGGDDTGGVLNVLAVSIGFGAAVL